MVQPDPWQRLICSTMLVLVMMLVNTISYQVAITTEKDKKTVPLVGYSQGLRDDSLDRSFRGSISSLDADPLMTRLKARCRLVVHARRVRVTSSDARLRVWRQGYA